MIAICGAHATGKSTLVDALASALPGYRVVEEPYHALIDDGYVFGDPPGVEDFEAPVAVDDGRDWRSRVDDELRRLLVDDELGVSAKVLEVRGSVADRTNRILDAVTQE